MNTVTNGWGMDIDQIRIELKGEKFVVFLEQEGFTDPSRLVAEIRLAGSGND
ncbi:hypothetical protein [Paenibacillus alginolyticus]|uniref:Uncharacterized protein n=1 Tax=Paenibacillus alginolyticus TaxID=59839 RepID=A0ABT4GGG8_9BACL|nr:hypothetical protein [Paenibacillus alginolyticus]MCY9695287.1 hypothetical protein [Paenibacillus alginolyticus]MEC0144821.1 hypothetical protein [Paenibacillus alginolyticus]